MSFRSSRAADSQFDAATMHGNGKIYTRSTRRGDYTRNDEKARRSNRQKSQGIDGLFCRINMEITISNDYYGRPSDVDDQERE